MRVLAFGTYDPAYARTRNLLDGLRLTGVEVVECNAPLWTGTDDKVATIRGGGRLLGFAARLLRAYARLLRQYAAVGDYDVMLILYGTLLDFYLGRLLAWLARRPLVLDVLMSVWVIAKERGLFQPGDWRERVIRLVEGTALRWADALLADTPQYVAVHQRLYGVAPAKFGLVPLGADGRLFRPAPDSLAHAARQAETFQIVYHGLFVPLHGVQWIVEAAARLRDHPSIRFTFIGDGVARRPAEEQARRLGLTNVEFRGLVPRAALQDALREADVVLGVFGTQLQGQVTTPNKIYEGIALGKPVVTAYTPASAPQFRHGAHLLFVPVADPQALADAILALRANPSLRAALAYGGRHLFETRYDLPQLGGLAKRHLEHELRGGRRAGLKPPR